MSLLSLSPTFSKAIRIAPRCLHSLGTLSHTSSPFIRSSLHIPSPWTRGPRVTWLNPSSNISQLSGRARPPNRGSQSGWSGSNHKQSPFAFLDKIPQDYVFWGIIGTNIMVFFMWTSADANYRVQGDPTNLKWMHKNFTSSWQNFSEGRIWAPITAMFSHAEVSHLFFNMFTFYFLGEPVLNMLGTRRFLGLYFGSGIAACFGSMFWHNKVNGRDVNSRGASGAVLGTNAYLACVAPTLTFLIYGIIPVPAWLFVSGIFVYDTYSAWNQQRADTDTAGHVAGLLAGVGYFLLRRFGF